MLVTIDNEKKYVDIWLRTGEPTPDIQKIKEKYPTFDISVFHSGERNLEMLTADLLSMNM